MKRSSDAALWLFGLLVGFSIKTALETVVPNILFAHGENSPLPPGHAPGTEYAIEGLFALLVVIVLGLRFLLGAMRYFRTDPEEARERKFFVLDLATAIVHFGLLYGLALAIEPDDPGTVVRTFNTTAIDGELLFSPFQLMLVWFLTFDIIWFVVRRPWRRSVRADPFVSGCNRRILEWTVFNAVSAALFAMVIFGGRLVGFAASYVSSSAMFAILLLSYFDLRCIVRREYPVTVFRNWVGPWLGWEQIEVPPVPAHEAPAAAEPEKSEAPAAPPAGG